MTAFSPTTLGDIPASLHFGRPSAGRTAAGDARGLLARLYDRFVAAWQPEPDLAEMGPSQINELLVMRGRDIA